MKILKLELCCFGPYVNKQVIDFTDLNKSRLYLVTGDTGAGKTILFDAIAFCLYGDSSGGVRKAIHFRSQNAPNDMETYAKLTFEIHQEVYEIKRSPSYPREGKKTNKPHSVELKMPNGEIFERPSEVGEKIKSIIGIDYEEFTSVVMIAQGRFDALIRASSKDKEAILREIFHTHEKRLLQDQMAKKASELKNEATIKKATLDTLIRQYEFSQEDYLSGHLFNKLKDLINENKSQLESCLKEKSVLEVQQKKIEKEDQLAQKRFDLETQLKNKSTDLNRLYQDKELFVKKEEKLQLLKKSQQLKPAYESLYELESELLRHEKAASALKITIDQLKVTCAKLEKEYSAHLASKQDYLDSQAKINELEKKKTAYITFQQLKNEANTLQSKLEAMLLKQTKLNEQLIDLKNKKVELEKQTSHLQPLGEVTLIVEHLANEMKSSYDLYQQILSRTSELNLLEEDKKAKTSSWQKAFKAYENKNNEYIKATRLYLASSAKVLASTLEEGMPCPVCGSLHHPTPATFDGQKIDKEALDALKLEVDKLNHKQEKSHSELVGCQAKIEALLGQIKDYEMDKLKADYDLKKESYETKKEALKQLEKETKKLNVDLEKNKLENEKVELNLKEVSQRILSISEQYSLVKGKLEGMQVKETSLEEIEERLQHLKDEVLAYEITETRLSKALENEKTVFTKNSVSYSHHQETYAKLKPRFENDKEAFKQELLSIDLDIQVFKQLLTELSKLELLEKEIQTYKQNVEVLKATIKQIQEQLESLPDLDLDSINKRKKQIKEAYEQILNAITKLKNTTALLTQGKQKLEKACLEFETVNKKKDEVVHLSSVLNGQNNLRMTFESYILSSYFDEILQLANIRLKMMTNGRYLLVRSKENQGGNRLQGLDLLVLDYESGKMRDINSLSGGETFKAALCLALGLSDMMSAKSGSIQIDTLFIDEGFGSLDEKSLDSAIEALSDLQNEGKIIGIISHVSELKERIDAKIVVKHNQEGSNAKVVFF